MLFSRNQQRIRCVDNDDVFDTDQGDQTIGVTYQDAAGRVGQHLGITENREVALAALRLQLCDCRKVTDVVPAEVCWDNGNATCGCSRFGDRGFYDGGWTTSTG